MEKTDTSLDCRNIFFFSLLCFCWLMQRLKVGPVLFVYSYFATRRYTKSLYWIKHSTLLRIEARDILIDRPGTRIWRFSSWTALTGNYPVSLASYRSVLLPAAHGIMSDASLSSPRRRSDTLQPLLILNTMHKHSNKDVYQWQYTIVISLFLPISFFFKYAIGLIFFFYLVIPLWHYFHYNWVLFAHSH